MWQYNYTDELCHYGVPGMKWGHRRVAKYIAKASTSRKSADEYDKKSKMAAQKGEKDNAKMFSNYANRARQDAEKYAKKAKERSAKIQKREDFYKKRIDINNSRSTGEKIAMNIVAGPFANRTYNSLVANGSSESTARYATIATNIFAGPIGHIMVSGLYGKGHGF